MFPLAVNKDRFFHDMHLRQTACHRYSIEDSMQCVQSCVLSCKPPDRGCRRHGWSRWDGSSACLFHILEVIFVLLIFLRQPLWRDGHESGCRIFSGSRLPCTEENVPGLNAALHILFTGIPVTGKEGEWMLPRASKPSCQASPDATSFDSMI